MGGLKTWAIWPLLALQGLRGTLFGWVPVFLACGIALWFALPDEPGVWVYSSVGILLLALLALRRWGTDLLYAPLTALACVAVGFLAIGFRAHGIAAPMLEHPYYGPVQGRIVEIDRSQSDALRLLLDQVVLEDMAPGETPRFVRISLHGMDMVPDFGQTVLITARLAAPDGPVEPGGFDFRRMAFFDQLGGVGYSRNPVILWAEPGASEQVINRLRMHMSRAITRRAPGDAGAFASGAMTGDRSGISRATFEVLRDSNLAHLLAISGMNMAFLTGFVFLLLRYGLALIPPLALRINTKKVAAVVGFGVALFYLLLSGSNVATERAFLMVSVMLGAILFDRRALTLRSVALSAVILLIWQPETLSEPGFQLSYAATVSLIAGFGALDRQVMKQAMPRWIMPLFTLVFSSVLAGASTAPYAAAYFNRFTDYGLLANLLTVPMMSVLMASGAMAALLAPLGMAAPAIWVMEASARWILFIAHWVAGLDGAVTPIIAPGPWVIPLISFGGCWVVLMRAPKVRIIGVLPVLIALGLWVNTTRPAVLISSDGGLVGLMGPEGRALSNPKGAGFAAENWLEKDGDLALQEEAAQRLGFEGPKTARKFVLAGQSAVVLTGEAASAALPGACAEATLVIIGDFSAKDLVFPPGCRVIDRDLLRQSGALAIWQDKEGLRFEPARRSARIWMGQEAAPDLPKLAGLPNQVPLDQ